MTDMCINGKNTCAYNSSESNYCPHQGSQNGCYNWSNVDATNSTDVNNRKNSKSTGLVEKILEK